jgi:hypothetical protein
LLLISEAALLLISEAALLFISEAALLLISEAVLLLISEAALLLIYLGSRITAEKCRAGAGVKQKMRVGPQKNARWPGKSQTKNARGPSKKM